MSCPDCEKREKRMREMEEEFSVKHDIKLALIVLLLVVALVLFMALIV